MFDIPFDIAFINKQLVGKFGTTLLNQPKYRVVWSETEIEHRKQDYVNGIYLLTPVVRLVPKYPYLRRQWVLEQWVDHNGNNEIATANGGTYEPVWAFTEGLRPVWRAVEIIALAAQNGVGQKLTEKDFERENAEEFAKEVEELTDILKSEGTDYGNQTDAFVKPIYLDSQKQKMRQ